MSYSPRGEFTCPACGLTESEQPAGHEMTNAVDAIGWPVLVCNYGVALTEHKIEGWGAGGGGAFSIALPEDE